MKKITISDPTLRDGSHAIKHQLTAEQVSRYCAAIDKAGVPIVEVGHGNGIGASSIQVGLSGESDIKLLEAARSTLKHAKLGVHCIPGFATIKKHIKPALDLGVDIVRCACHCTEADTTRNHITFVREQGKQAFGVLMMAHMAPVDILVEEAMKMESYGAEAVIIMDSAGAFLPNRIETIISRLCDTLNVHVGYHGHNNLGMGIGNSIVAAGAGATIIDGTARCFGAGAGNTQLEILVPVLEKLGYSTGIDFYKLLDAADLAEKELLQSAPRVKSISVVSGLSGVFSGFTKHVERISKEYDVDPRDVFFKLGERGIIAGQEDMIIEEAYALHQKKTGKPL
ncbi:MAG: 4-hydroxy-2-oxovalerate aldolase [Deltaproteobacteria bacterium]|nr:4-hydroxy-2-oxovalerate aldolase [Deltaproteobacteria bacterium]MBT4090889.1 4-hydroxy-2-oxovalerate aldolase [Deltaproteobacteria bacterium]MBT4268156.1 4-hydroxy-2-oxovalerate aldolase [Deltaproteobacteria bacterium]MBT4640215.1 4-hydroxy-2-oxovalerate aldolase [Deltaproteobacteria bacterium]MBT6613619.1 4-hydroxy-2-oxovalerate aldolase [Deltaproteobacteria bacterium]